MSWTKDLLIVTLNIYINFFELYVQDGVKKMQISDDIIIAEKTNMKQDDDKKNKTNNSSSSSSGGGGGRREEAVDNVGIMVEAAGSAGEKKGNYYSNMPTIRASSVKAGPADMMGTSSDIETKTTQPVKTTQPDDFIKYKTARGAALPAYTAVSGAQLNLSDNTGEYAEIFDSYI